MGKNIKYGEFTFNKPNPRPTVKGYSFGGAAESAAEPMAAKQPMGMSPPPTPMKKPVVTQPPAPLTPAMQRQKENQAVINKANARDGGNRLIDPAAMKAALDRNLAIRQATDARHKAEAKANAIPSKNPYARSAMPIARKKGGEVKGYAMGGEYQADDAPIQRRNSKLKAMKLKMAEEAKRDAAQSRSRYEAEQEMSQSKANLLPSPVRMKKGGEVQGYAAGGMSARVKAMAQKFVKPNAPQKSPMVQPQPTVLPEMPPQRFVNSSNLSNKFGMVKKLLNDKGLMPPSPPPPPMNSGNLQNNLSNKFGMVKKLLENRGLTPPPPPMNSGNFSNNLSNKMGFLRKALGNRISMPPPMPMAQPSQALGGIETEYAPSNQQTGYAPPPNIQQLASQLASRMNGPIPEYAQPYINQDNQSPVNALTQAGMPPQMEGAGIANIGVGTGTGTGTTSAFKRGGSVSKGKAMESSSKDKAQDKAMIKKAMKQHDQQEHKGGKGTVLKLKQGGKPPVKGVKLVGMKREPQAVIKKEISLLKKAGAPAKMIKHEEIEAASPMVSMGGMRKGGSAMKKGVPTFNRTPKC